LYVSRWHEVASALEYNQLKIRVLTMFRGSEELASEDIRRLLSASQIELSDKAVKMALMRYTRQGILVRGKKAGLFRYRLTEKGMARRDWLSRTR
jgi:predicted transcriptional regulator